MKTFFTIIALFAGTARAGMWLVVDTRTTNAIPNQRSARIVDVADQSAIWQEYRRAGGDVPQQIPAWFNDRLKLYSFAANYTGAVADIQQQDNARRPAKAKLQTFLGTNTPRQFRQSLKAIYRNFTTNTAYTVAQRTINSNVLWALQAEDDFAELREEKRAEDLKLGILKEDEP
jgi:hypothetical protein